MGRNLGGITDSIKGAAPTESQWLKEPYVGRIEIKSIVYSEDIVNNGVPYTGKPYFKYLIETKGLDENKKTEIYFWRPASGEDETKSNNKLLKIKRFYDSCQVDQNLKDEKYLEAIVGKECNAVIQMQERALLQAKPPKLVNNASFWFSKPVDEAIDVTADKLYNRLSDAELAAFHKAADAYNKAHPEEEKPKSMNPNKEFEQSTEEPTDDLEF